jgi:ribulose-phosphate 3-epimerase
MIRVAPSLIGADLLHLGDQIRRVEMGGADWLHVDILDGYFVPGFSFGAGMIEELHSFSQLPIEVHLMSARPLEHMHDFLAAGCDLLTIHVEAVADLYCGIATIKRHNIRAGVALNPATPLSVLDEILPEVDQVLIMTIIPGSSGSPLIDSCLTKAGRLVRLLKRRKLHHVQVVIDGGVTVQNIANIVAQDIDGVVSGTGIFSQLDPAEAIQEMKRLSAGGGLH